MARIESIIKTTARLPGIGPKRRARHAAASQPAARTSAPIYVAALAHRGTTVTVGITFDANASYVMM